MLITFSPLSFLKISLSFFNYHVIYPTFRVIMKKQNFNQCFFDFTCFVKDRLGTFHFFLLYGESSEKKILSLGKLQRAVYN